MRCHPSILILILITVLVEVRESVTVISIIISKARVGWSGVSSFWFPHDQPTKSITEIGIRVWCSEVVLGAILKRRGFKSWRLILKLQRWLKSINSIVLNRLVVAGGWGLIVLLLLVAVA